MHWSKLLLLFAGLLVFTKGSQYFAAVKILLNARFKKASGELKNSDELPEYLERLLPRYDIKLQSLGFAFSHLQLFDDSLASNYSRRWKVVYFNQVNKCYASLVIAPLPDALEPVKAEFSNIFSDGNALATISGAEHDIIGEIPNAIVNDSYAVTLEEQYQSHIDKLVSLGRESIAPCPEDFLSNEVEFDNAYIDSLIQRGLLKSKDRVIWRLRLMPAMKHAFKIVRGTKKLAAFKTAQRKAAGEQNIEPIDVPIEAEVNAYLRQEDTFKSSGSGLWWKVMVFLASLVVGVAIFGTVFPGLAAIYIIAALIVHELGHYIGMLIFGYKDRQIMFMPFGAATLGERTDAAAWQRAIVYLLGPAVGLITGTILMLTGATTESHILSGCGFFFLVLNYINLLPIVPLDGGRLFELALFSRVPVLKSVFLILSVLVMATGAIITRDPFLIIITLLMAAGIKGQVMLNSVHSRINKRIKTRQAKPDKETLLSEIFGTLKQKSFAKFPSIRKQVMARNLMNNLLQRPPGIGATIVSLLLYVIVIALPVIIVFGLGIFVGLATIILS